MTEQTRRFFCHNLTELTEENFGLHAYASIFARVLHGNIRKLIEKIRQRWTTNRKHAMNLVFCQDWITYCILRTQILLPGHIRHLWLDNAWQRIGGRVTRTCRQLSKAKTDNEIKYKTTVIFFFSYCIILWIHPFSL